MTRISNEQVNEILDEVDAIQLRRDLADERLVVVTTLKLGDEGYEDVDTQHALSFGEAIDELHLRL